MVVKTKKKIGKYSVVRQIGKGSAANIYLAKQDALGRRLVIKELLPLHSSNDKIVSRFKREAKVVSQLSHDTIVHVYDYWVRGNSYYIAMEYVQGITLKDLLSTMHHLPVHIAAIIVYQICRGLSHAHCRGIVHRDLKPSNIMISNSGQVKILDFGIAHFQYDEDLTSLGAVIGTYSYMSPEQAMGKNITPSSDIFSLGILFYELLTGTRPFVKDEKGDVLEKIIRRGIRSPGKINPAVPGSFNTIIRKCLRKKPNHRFSSTDEIKNRLERYLKRYSLDHQKILRDFFENISPRKLEEGWPPKFWKRQWYRITHLRVKTYLLIFIILLSFGLLEYGLISSGRGLRSQYNYLSSKLKSLYDFLLPGKVESGGEDGTVKNGIDEINNKDLKNRFN